MKKNLHHSRGQVILIILLVTVVGLTIGLSLVSRTIQDVQLSSQISESQKAFSAAESGIEAALTGSELTTSPVTLSLDGGSANYTVTKVGGSTDPIPVGTVGNGDSFSVWLVEHGNDGSLPDVPPVGGYTNGLKVCWGDTDGTPAAMEMTLLYYTGTEYRIGKEGYDPTPSRSENFSPTSPAGAGDPSSCSYVVNITNWNSTFDAGATPRLVELRLKPIYADATITLIPASSSFPSQGKLIASTGKTTSGVARKITVFQGYSALPGIFDYTFFTN